MPESHSDLASSKSMDRAVVNAAMQRVATGDQAAFAAVYDALSPRVFGLVLRILVDRSQAEEVTQEVFLDIWQKAPKFDAARGSAVSWALQLAHSKAVDRVRSSQSQRDRDERIGVRDAVGEASDVSDVVELRVESERIRSALDDIAPAQREAVVLAYFQGLTQREIAERTGTPLGTVKTRLRDGLSKLRIALEVS